MEIWFLIRHLLKKTAKATIFKKKHLKQPMKLILYPKESPVPLCHQKVIEVTSFRIRLDQICLAKMIQLNNTDESMKGNKCAFKKIDILYSFWKNNYKVGIEVVAIAVWVQVNKIVTVRILKLTQIARISVQTLSQ